MAGAGWPAVTAGVVATALLWVTTVGAATGRWCERPVLVTEQEEVTPRREAAVPCPSLYQYSLAGWRLDRDRTRRQRGNPPGDTGTEPALCYIYRPPEMQPVTRNRTERGCCPGWSGARCTEGPGSLGRCFSAWQCQASTGGHNGSAMSRAECCQHPWGHSWRRGDSGDAEGPCLPCTRLPLGGDGDGGSPRHRSPPATCQAWAGTRFRTFDGRHFGLRGTCHYSLATATDGSWDVTIGLGHARVLHMTFGTDTVVAEGHNVLVNGAVVTQGQPYLHKGLGVTWPGDWVAVASSLGVRVAWDRHLAVTVTVEPELRGGTWGLCGTYTDDPADDFVRPEGDMATSAAAFGSAWQVPLAATEPPCRDVPEGGPRCGPGEVAVAVATCGRLLAQPFQQCHGEVDPSGFYAACVALLCGDGDPASPPSPLSLPVTPPPAVALPSPPPPAACDTLAAYARECSRRQLHVSWRHPGLCERRCDTGQRFSDCVSLCPVTCATAGGAEQGPCQRHCHGGCECGPGLARDGPACVPPAACPCHHRRQRYEPGQSIRQRCNRCTCEAGRWRCDQRRCPAECAVLGGRHFVTFDRRRFSLPAPCAHTLVEDFVAGRLLITAEHEPCDSRGSPSCPRTLTVTTGRTTARLHGTGEVTVAGREVTLPFSGAELSIRRASSAFLHLQAPGAHLLWGLGTPDTFITLQPAMAGTVRGLCGTFNGDQRDEFTTPEGDVEPGVAAFANAFRAAGACPVLGPAAPEPCAAFPGSRERAEVACAVLMGPAFQPCHRVVDPEPFLELCRWDVCSCREQEPERCRCPALGAYGRECAREGTELSWRNRSLCDEPCPGGQQYRDCGGPCGRSCSEPPNGSDCPPPDMLCVPGCRCPEGLLLAPGGQCVPPAACPCPHGARLYPPGARIRRGCQACVCMGGSWRCAPAPCPPGPRCPPGLLHAPGSCLRRCDPAEPAGTCGGPADGCVCPPGTLFLDGRCVSPDECPCHHGGQLYPPNATIARDCNTCVCLGQRWHCGREECAGTCVATGDPHYVTFDGRAFTFAGDCEYLLAREATGLFAVTAENVPCGATGVTCTKSVVVAMGNTVVHMLRGREVTVNGVAVRPPKVFGGSGLALQRAGLFLLLLTRLGVAVLWDGGTRVYVRASPRLRGRLAGLCGNFDGDAENDFGSRDGALEATPEIFGDSWRLSPLCPEADGHRPHPCEESPQRAAWARGRCGVLQHQLFSPCHHLVPPERFYEWCLFDACGCDSGGDCECLCTALAAYAEECGRRGTALRWRSQGLCPLQCEGGQEYNPCGPPCPPTCRDLGRDPPELCGALGCLEGCFCPPGQVLHDGQCVEPPACPCFWDGFAFPAGASVTQGCSNCTCLEGRWQCPPTPSPCPAAACAPWEFRCRGGGLCVPGAWLCDNEDDCGDGSDELCDPPCAPQQPRCPGGRCLPWGARCDGVTHCPDGWDEAGCPGRPCAPPEFACAGGRCLPPGRVCDGRLDCPPGDHSDEAGCAPRCGPGQFRCGTGRCVPYPHRCDGRDDCGDGSDESGCACPEGHLPCPGGGCQPPAALCDGRRHCPDGADEANCPARATCAPGTVPCPDGSCVAEVAVCDGARDCRDGWDESPAGCAVALPPAPLSPVTAVTAVTSATGTVANTVTDTVADTVPDTATATAAVADTVPVPDTVAGPANASAAPCPPRSLRCDSGACVPRGWRCDGDSDCPDGSDEGGCDPPCAPGHLPCDPPCDPGRAPCAPACIPPSHLCDGVPHCRDSADESPQLCEPPGPGSTPGGPCAEFDCGDGECVTFQQVCDGLRDCGSAEDERGCGLWAPWGPWGSCNHPCGPGGQRRVRGCHQSHPGLLRACRGPREQERPCFHRACPVDGAWGPWGPWSDCPGGCGGVRLRTRGCQPPQNGGRACEELPGGSPGALEMAPCAPGGCSNASQCSEGLRPLPCAPCPASCADLASAVTCPRPPPCRPGCWCPAGQVLEPPEPGAGPARCVRTRDCPCEAGGLRYPPGAPVPLGCRLCTCLEGHLRHCRPHPGCSVDCGWSSWSPWGRCSGACGTPGVQWSFRSPSNPARRGGGRHCRGIYRKARRCRTAPCPRCRERGGWRVPGERWRGRPCQVCQCLPGGTVRCVPYCPLRHAGCPQGQVLRGGDGGSCCTCGPAGDNATATPPGMVTALSPAATPGPTAGPRETPSEPPSAAGHTPRTATPPEDTPRPLGGSATPHEPPQLPARPSLAPTGVPAATPPGCAPPPWGVWGSCSRSCGVGVALRRRRENLPQGGCAHPPNIDSRVCFLQACPVAGRWAPWGSWSRCDAPCGGGQQSRRRSCSDPPPKNGGRPCEGGALQSRPCNLRPCGDPPACPPQTLLVPPGGCADLGVPPCPPTCADLSGNISCPGDCEEGCRCRPGLVLQGSGCIEPGACGVPAGVLGDPRNRGSPESCGWSRWTPWTHCDCDTGTRQRFRSPTNPAAAAGGAPCTGSPREVRGCPELCGPEPGSAGPPGVTEEPTGVPGSPGSPWGTEATWGTESPWVTEPPVSPEAPDPAHGQQWPRATESPGVPVSPRGTESPRSPEAAVAARGQWSPWGPWGGCSAPCGGGERWRRRGCATPPCPGPALQSQSCHSHVCREAGCPPGRTFRECGEDSGCPRSCAQLGGAVGCAGGCQEGCHCPPGTFLHRHACLRPQQCPCSVPAALLGGGTAGAPPGTIPGTPFGTTPGPEPAGTPPGDPPLLELPPGGTLRLGCARCSCLWGRLRCAPSEGSLCNETRTETPQCPSPPCAEEPGPTADLSPTSDLSPTAPGPEEEAGGSPAVPWEPWGPWGPCSRTCTHPETPASRSRRRHCAVGNCGAGGSTQSRACNLSHCQAPPCLTPPCPCQWSPWGSWGSCSRPCGGGQQRRLRAFSPPGPGDPWCPQIRGGHEQRRPCGVTACRVNGAWSPWGPWSRCDVTCGGGRSVRSRSCSRPPPKNGGSPCSGGGHELRVCNPRPCGPRCPPGQSLSPCASRCPRSCRDLREGASCEGGSRCEPGCRCPPGTLEQDGGCVPPALCPCLDSGGHLWVPGGGGDPRGCRNCTCAAGRLRCEPGGCPPPSATPGSPPATPATPACTWSRWSRWGACSVTCGGGRQQRYRTPIPAEGAGGACGLPQEQGRGCEEAPCPPLCPWAGGERGLGERWSPGPCRLCTCTPEGPECWDTPCATEPCDWSPWGPWGPCGDPCAGGSRLRHRHPLNPETPGRACAGVRTQSESCGSSSCPAAACGGGRTRSPCAGRCPRSCGDTWAQVLCLQGPCEPGCRCPPGQLLQDGLCVPLSRCRCATPGGDNGTREVAPGTVTRIGCHNCTCDNGTWSCPGLACPSPVPATPAIPTSPLSPSSSMSPLSPAYPVSHLSPSPPVSPMSPLSPSSPLSPAVSPWSPWSRCSRSCGGGTRRRHRQCPGASGAGSWCGDSPGEETAPCNPEECPGCPPGEVWLDPGPACERSCQDLAEPPGTCGGTPATLGASGSPATPGTLGTPDTSSTPATLETLGTPWAPPRCACAPGRYRNGSGQCVSAGSCGCRHRGAVRAAGSEWQEPCGTCRCSEGRVTCATSCPALTCPEGTEPVREPGSCCPVCRDEWPEEPPGPCRLLTALRTIAKGACVLRGVRVTYCAGACRSRTAVSAQEPYVRSLCECCSYRLDPARPVRALLLPCPRGRPRPALLPRIAQCHCEPCRGGDFTRR